MTSKTSSVAPLGVRKVERPRPLRSFSHIGIPASANMGNASNIRRMSAQGIASVEEALQLLDFVTSNLEAQNYDKLVVSAVIRLNAAMKSQGSHLELFHRDLLDKAQVTLRNACKDSSLDIVARLHILEIIELRSMKWVLNDDVINYYRQKLSQIDYVPEPSNNNNSYSNKKSLNVNAPLFTPTHFGNGGNILDQLLPHQNTSAIPLGEVIASSGKYTGPIQQQGKSYYKDEIYIRNVDSGKVMGVRGKRVHMIEEMSDTIISFQKVAPGSVDRLVQITGSIPGNVAQAKQLVEDTIRRNQSPLPDFMADSQQILQPTVVPSYASEYKFTVKVGNELVKVSSTNLELVKSAKIVLDEFFTTHHGVNVLAGSLQQKVGVARQPLYPEANRDVVNQVELEDGRSKERRANFAKTSLMKLLTQGEPETRHESAANVSSMKVYDRDFLLRCSESPLSVGLPPDWENVIANNPDVVRKVRSYPSGDGSMRLFASAMSQAFNKYHPILDALRPDLPKKTWDASTGQWIEEANTRA